MEYLKQLRIEKRLSQEELGKRLGVSQEAISSIERGRRAFTHRMAAKYSKYFRIPRRVMEGLISED